jgi:serine acetyltransferase
MVAAASVVVENVPNGWVVKGSPAKKYIRIEEYLKKQSEYERKKYRASL